MTEFLVNKIMFLVLYNFYKVKPMSFPGFFCSLPGAPGPLPQLADKACFYFLPNQIFWITKYLDSRLNSDLFKTVVQIGHVWTLTDNNFLNFFEYGSHFWTALTLQLVDGFQQFFFSNRSEFHPESKYFISCKVWFGIFSQIKKR